MRYFTIEEANTIPARKGNRIASETPAGAAKKFAMQFFKDYDVFPVLDVTIREVTRDSAKKRYRYRVKKDKNTSKVSSICSIK